ncbi:MAG: insulinase family protein [Myxococcales bacterium]|nr:insulinase family protein [Myxococcales bacterium]
MTRFSLPNGVRVIVLPDKRLPIMTTHLMLRVGSIDDPADRAGLAELAVALVARGSTRTDAEKLAELVDSAGLKLAAATEYELSHVSCRGRARYAERCLALVGELVRTPRLAEGELERLRRKLGAEARQARDDPATLAELHFDNQLFGEKHPLGRATTLASLARISRDDVKRFVARHVIAKNAVLAISGDVSPERVRAWVREHFGSWPAEPQPPPRRVRPLGATPRGLSLLLVDKPGLTQSFIALGHRGISRRHPLRDAARLLNHVLSGLRLSTALRQRGGKTYSVRSRFDIATDDGSFIVKTYTRNAELTATLALVRAELERIRREPPNAAELRAARGRLAGGYNIRFRTNAKLAAVLGQAALFGLSERYVSELGLRLYTTSPHEVEQASRLVDAGALVGVIVGPASRCASALRAAGLRFETVSYLAPISAAERARARAAAKRPVSSAERARARALVDAAWRHAGGPRLARLRALTVEGMLRVVPAVSFKSPPLSGPYTLHIERPGKLDLAMTLRAEGTTLSAKSRQRLRGSSGTISHDGKTRALSAPRVRALRFALWRQPILVLDNARRPDVKLRPLAPSELASGQRGVEARAAEHPAVQLIFSGPQSAPRLVALRYRDRAQRLRSSQLSRHRRVDGVLVAHGVVTTVGRREQTLSIGKLRFVFAPR